MRTIKEDIIKILDLQNEKGYATYGVTIDDQDKPYDWNMMMVEELIDALQYALKQNRKLVEENWKMYCELESLKGGLKK